MSYCLSSNREKAIKKLFTEMDISFSEKLLMFIEQRKMKDPEVYKAANISKQLFHTILSNKHYHPKKTTVLSLAVGLRLNLSETEELLSYAGYVMARNDEFDVIVKYFIENKIYDINLINIVLYNKDLQLLGSNR